MSFSENSILLITPPFTQLNTPYPATAYLKGFLNTLNRKSIQADLGIEVILKLFCKNGLAKLFKQLEASNIELSDNSYRIYALREEYMTTIDAVILFLQNKNPTLAHSICTRGFLPEASRFAQLEDLEWAFGAMGIHDKARHFCTLYLEDLGDLIQEAVDPYFGFSRYAERLGRSATNFNTIDEALKQPNSIFTEFLCEVLESYFIKSTPSLVCISVPFPGNLFCALKCGQWIKSQYPEVKIVLGGGYANTELRSVKDKRLFDYLDFVSLDDGEAPLQILLEYLDGNRAESDLKRMFRLENDQVTYINAAKEKDVPQRDTGTPDYTDLLLNDYLSVIEVVNPMHRLWSDGRWNKLTLAHGCYWGKCTFCDISLDYIRRYEPMTAALLCDRIEEIILQTNQNGFHFVDEAAPPALLRDLALEIIRRKLVVVWWTNIRFERNFTSDLCVLLKASGCIAVSGGLEVASDRLLALIKKGVTVAQVARVTHDFTSSGIMVHSYLMYGFPTQTAQETIDSLEMVRQLFEQGAIQSGFWHRFAMTAHSPVGLHPEMFDVTKIEPENDTFANNDLDHIDPLGANHALFSEGLRKSLFNYMHGVCLDFPLHRWFDFKVPKTTIPKRYIEKSIQDRSDDSTRSNALVIWLGSIPEVSIFTDEDGVTEIAELVFYDKTKEFALETNVEIATWFCSLVPQLSIGTQVPLKFTALKVSFEKEPIGDFETFLESPFWQGLRSNKLLIV